jgi:hypothetical protein
MGSDAALVLVKFVLVLPVVVLDDPDLLVSQTGEPAHDLLVGATLLEVRNQVVNRDPAGRELEPSATINKCDLFLHPVPLGASPEHDGPFSSTSTPDSIGRTHPGLRRSIRAFLPGKVETRAGLK